MNVTETIATVRTALELEPSRTGNVGADELSDDDLEMVIGGLERAWIPSADATDLPHGRG